MPDFSADQLGQQFAALQAAALGLLLAGITNDGERVGHETQRILDAGANVTGAVIGFMTAHASEAFVHQHGSREAAIDAVTAELTRAELAASEVTPDHPRVTPAVAWPDVPPAGVTRRRTRQRNARRQAQR